MNYCEHHLADYALRSRTFGLLAHGAYSMLRDRYFDTERPIPDGDVYEQACAKSKDERAAVDKVLREFFRLDDGVWRCDEFDRQIERTRAKIERSKQNGRVGGRPPRRIPQETQQEPSGLSVGLQDGTHTKAHQTPDTIQIHSEPNGSGAAAPQPDPADVIFALGVPLLTAAGVSDRNARSMLGLQRKQHGDTAVIEAIRRCASEKPLQPVPWLQAALKAKPQLNRREAVEDDNRRIALAWAQGGQS